MKKILIISMLLSLVGCATVDQKDIQKKQDAIVEDKIGNSVVYPSGTDAQPCDDFPLFTGKTMGDLYAFVVNDVSKSYQVCKDKLKVNQDFINTLKK